MSLSGIEWSLKAAFDNELRTLTSKPVDSLSTQEKSVVDYLTARLQELDDKRKKNEN